MKITVNFREIDFDRSTLQDLLAMFKFSPERIKVAKNGETVARESYGSTLLKDGDVLDIDRVSGR
jgi:thiamine biosynthesis protein ThiS